VRSWWLTGGITPDHSVIGRFLNDHAQRLSEEFFESLTREVLKVTRSSTQSLAGDGTVVQAAASRYRGVKQEAAEEAAKESRRRAEADPENEKLGRQAEQAEGVAQAVRERVATRKRQRSKKAKDAKVSPSEPEAVFQPLKDKSIAPSYKPTLLANQERIIVGQQVQASSETRGFGALLRQAKRINGGVKQLLLDAGFFVGKVMETALAEGVEDLLCPKGATLGSRKNKSSKGFAKSAFHYDEQSDCYECPAGEKLVPVGQSHDDGKRFTRYGGAPCQHCELRDQCTSNPRGRTVKRYEDDEIKDALREVMRHPAAQREYSRRKGMVEPVFSELKGLQGLQRFRRRGLDKVRLEFALHATAHNLRRLVALTQASEKALERISGAFWQLLQLPIGLFQDLRLLCSRFSGEHHQNSSLHSSRVTA
jgi:IS5 family transposase